MIISFWGAKKRLIIRILKNYLIVLESLAYIYAYYIFYKGPLIIYDEPYIVAYYSDLFYDDRPNSRKRPFK